jgi:hypothetical protein
MPVRALSEGVFDWIDVERISPFIQAPLLGSGANQVDGSNIAEQQAAHLRQLRPTDHQQLVRPICRHSRRVQQAYRREAYRRAAHSAAGTPGRRAVEERERAILRALFLHALIDPDAATLT